MPPRLGIGVMNASALRKIVEEDSEPVRVAPDLLSAFDRGRVGVTHNPRSRAFGIALTAGIHALLIAGFLFAGPSLVKVIPRDLMVVSLEHETVKPADLPPPPKLEKIVLPQVEIPEFSIDTPPPATAITAAPPKPAAVTPTAAPNESKSYFARLLAKLYSHKRYPEAARLKREKGVAVIRIVMERNGTVTSVTLVNSSGSAALDAEAVALPMRAQPLPAMPDSMTQERLTMNVNVDFLRIH